MTLCCIALGSNLEQPIKQLQLALLKLATLDKCELLKSSSLYRSSPQGPQDQDDYINAAALIETTLSPVELLQQLQAIEQHMGRIKTRYWGERVIDLDLIFYGQETIRVHHPDLTVPHPRALERDFVVIPLLEIVPDWRLPNGEALANHANQCTQFGLQRLTAPHTE